MSKTKTMMVDERRTYLRLVQNRYLEASRKGKGRPLDQMEEITGLHRKSLIRLLAGSL
jgi:hypothetical protein